MATGAIPIRIGLLYDFPQGDGLFSDSLRLGLDDVAATGRLDREIELVDKQARGLPSGSEHDIVCAFGVIGASCASRLFRERADEREHEYQAQ